jgi:hypothetical protein
MSFLSPLDLLSLSSVEQDVVRCLAKQPNLTMAEIADVTNIALAKLKELLPQMVAEKRLAEERQNGHSVFTLEFNKEKPSSNPFLSDLFDL